MKYLYGTRNIWILPFALLLLSGCTFPSKFEVFNNTGDELRVIQVIAENRKSFDLAPGDSLILEQWEAFSEAQFTVITGDKRWQYKPVYISHHFGELRRFSHWLFKLQIEKDGSVFVLGPKNEFPQKEHIAQPEGYPLRPSNENV